MAAAALTNPMKREAQVLNLFCIIAAIVFLALGVMNALLSGQFLTTDNLFITTVCLVMALMFAVNPLLYLKSEGKLPIPSFRRKSAVKSIAGTAPPLLDARGRAMPVDVKAMVTRMQQPQTKDV